MEESTGQKLTEVWASARAPSAVTVAAKEQDLIGYRRFKPHKLSRPTIFNTDDEPGGGIVISEGNSVCVRDSAEGKATGGCGRGESGIDNWNDRGSVETQDVGTGNEVEVQEGALETGSVVPSRRGEGRLLNAWEKIEELEGLVESSRSHNEG